MKTYSISGLILVSAMELGLSPQACTSPNVLNPGSASKTPVKMAVAPPQCIANQWGKTIALLSDYAQGSQVFVFANKSNALYAATPVDNYRDADGKFGVMVHQDCTVSLQAQGNSKFVAVWDDSTGKQQSVVANHNASDKRARYEVAANYDGTYKFRSVGSGTTLMVDPQQQLRTTRPEVTLSNDPAYFQAMNFRVLSYGF